MFIVLDGALALSFSTQLIGPSSKPERFHVIVKDLIDTRSSVIETRSKETDVSSQRRRKQS